MLRDVTPYEARHAHLKHKQRCFVVFKGTARALDAAVLQLIAQELQVPNFFRIQWVDGGNGYHLIQTQSETPIIYDIVRRTLIHSSEFPAYSLDGDLGSRRWSRMRRSAKLKEPWLELLERLGLKDGKGRPLPCTVLPKRYSFGFVQGVTAEALLDAVDVPSFDDFVERPDGVVVTPAYGLRAISYALRQNTVIGAHWREGERLPYFELVEFRGGMVMRRLLTPERLEQLEKLRDPTPVLNKRVLEISPKARTALKERGLSPDLGVEGEQPNCFGGL